jgi:hypothetical protein
MAAAGRSEEGIAQMYRSISDSMITEGISTALMLAALADTCAKNARPAEGLDLVAKGLETAERTGVRLAAAELHRITAYAKVSNPSALSYSEAVA